MNWSLALSYSETSDEGKSGTDTDALSEKESPLDAFFSVELM